MCHTHGLIFKINNDTRNVKMAAILEMTSLKIKASEVGF